jgi:mono/diheme cytochrome c family protein
VEAVSAAAGIGMGLAAAGALALAAAAAEDGAAERGAYLARAGGCFACHTDHEGGGAPLAGGGRIETPFGTFVAPNLTPDAQHGLGGWTEADFVDAMTRGRAPDGSRYYPAFPYVAYSGMRRDDLADLWAYLSSLAPVARPNEPHDLAWPFRWRFLNRVWQWLFFRPRTFASDPAHDAAWNRGAYLAETLLHCKECHTPRNMLGALKTSLAYAGNRDGPGDSAVPNITPDRDTGIGKWTEIDIAWLLETGFKPDGNDVQGAMSELIEYGSSHLTEDDRMAVATYILSLAPIRYQWRKPKPAAPADAGGRPPGDDYDYDFTDDE